jgi:hypothetical protein
MFKFNPFTGLMDWVEVDLCKPDSDKVDVYDSLGGMLLTTSYQALLFDQTRTITSVTYNYNVATGEITFLTDGDFLVMARVTTNTTTGSTRSLSSMILEADTGAGYATIPGTLSLMYNREINEGGNTGIAHLVYSATAGDKIRVMVKRDFGNNLETEAGGSSLSVLSYSGTRGLQGPPGVGGNPSAGTLGDVQYSDGLGNFDATNRFNWNGNQLTLSSSAPTPIYTFDTDTSFFSMGANFDYDGTRYRFNDDIYMQQYLRHDGDTNTYMRFQTDQIDFVSGGVTLLRLDEDTQDGVTINPGFNNVDFAVGKNIAGNAIAYDSGLDELTLNSDTLIDAAFSSMKPVYNAAISALQVVRADGDNAVNIANNDTYENASVVGIAYDTGGPAFNGRVVSHGRIQDASFTFGDNVTLYLGASGSITATAPTTGALCRIGKSLGNGSIFINIDDPIEL